MTFCCRLARVSPRGCRNIGSTSCDRGVVRSAAAAAALGKPERPRVDRLMEPRMIRANTEASGVGDEDESRTESDLKTEDVVREMTVLRCSLEAMRAAMVGAMASTVLWAVFQTSPCSSLLVFIRGICNSCVSFFLICAFVLLKR